MTLSVCKPVCECLLAHGKELRHLHLVLLMGKNYAHKMPKVCTTCGLNNYFFCLKRLIIIKKLAMNLIYIPLGVIMQRGTVYLLCF